MSHRQTQTNTDVLLVYVTSTMSHRQMYSLCYINECPFHVCLTWLCHMTRLCDIDDVNYVCLTRLCHMTRLCDIDDVN